MTSLRIDGKIGQAYRLPTEAEWEYACRAGTQTTYWWGDEFDPTMLNSSVTWRQGDAPWPRDEHTLITPVDRYPANPFGLHDMLGNNWEWVQDYASADHYATEVRRPECPRWWTPRAPPPNTSASSGVAAGTEPPPVRRAPSASSPIRRCTAVTT